MSLFIFLDFLLCNLFFNSIIFCSPFILSPLKIIAFFDSLFFFSDSSCFKCVLFSNIYIDMFDIFFKFFSLIELRLLCLPAFVNLMHFNRVLLGCLLVYLFFCKAIAYFSFWSAISAVCFSFSCFYISFSSAITF